MKAVVKVKKLVSKRENKGIELFLRGAVKPLTSKTFVVESESLPDKQYIVRWNKKKWICNCEDYAKSKRKCKHIYAVCYYLTVMDLGIGVKKIGVDRAKCPICGKEDRVIKNGYSETRSGLIQRYYCKRCSKGFTAKTEFEGMHGQALAILLSLDLYYRGLSLRNIAEHLRSVYGICVSHGTIYGWIKRYVSIISEYMKRICVKTSERWHMDDTVVRVRSRHLTLWGVLDSETRLLIATHISEGKHTKEIYSLIDKALKISKERPDDIITDGAPQYAAAIDRKFKTELKNPIIHVQAAINTPLNNNKMERIFKTIKQRYKTINNFNSKESAEVFIEGFQAYYNAIKPHKALNGKSPLQELGVINERSWLELIKKAKPKPRKLKS